MGTRMRAREVEHCNAESEAEAEGIDAPSRALGDAA